MSRSKSKRRVTALALGAAIAVSACSGDDDADSATSTSETTESTTSTSESTSTTDPEAELKAEVEGAHEAYWQGYLKIVENPNPSNPLVEELHTGPALESMRDSVSQRILAGEATRLPDNRDDFQVKTVDVELEGNVAAIVTGCFVDGLVVYKVDTKEIVDDEVFTAIKTIRMVRESGRWKVAAVNSETVEGNPRCDGY